MQQAAIRLARILLLNPASPGETVVSALVAVFAFVMTVNAVGSALNMALARSGRSLAVLAVGGLVIVGALAILDYRFSAPGWVLIAAGVGITLMMIVPCMRFLLGGTYPAALASLALGVGGMVAALLLVHAVFGAVSGGAGSVGKGLKHKRLVETAVEGE